MIKNIVCLIFVVLFCSLIIKNADAAGRYSMPKAPASKQGYTRQAGGNAKQNTTVEYDRGNKRYTQQVKPGQTFYTPKGASNVTTNGRPTTPSSRATTTPQGAIIFGN